MIVLKQSETFLWGGGGQAGILSGWPGSVGQPASSSLGLSGITTPGPFLRDPPVPAVGPQDHTTSGFSRGGPHCSQCARWRLRPRVLFSMEAL